MHSIIAKDKLYIYEKMLLEQNVFFEKNATPLMVVNKDRAMVKVNSKFIELFGYAKDELLGRQTVLLTPTEDMYHEYAAYFKKTKMRLNEGKEFQYKKSDGSLFWVKLEGNPIYESEEDTLILWTFMDVTKEVEYREKLKLLASTDPLTNLYNRRHFFEIVEHILNLAKRDQRELLVAMIDIDNFKNINDTFGHQVGDKVIVALSNLLLENTRESDIHCRFGGEEFLILFTNIDTKNIKYVADNIRQKVEDKEIKIENMTLKFTISIGISQVNIKEDRHLDSTISRADKALYKAKRNGRNRVEISL